MEGENATPNGIGQFHFGPSSSIQGLVDGGWWMVDERRWRIPHWSPNRQLDVFFRVRSNHLYGGLYGALID